MVRERASRSEEGFALISAIITLAIMLLLASGMIAVSSFGIVRARRDLQFSMAETFADAIIAQTALSLADQRIDERPRVDGMPSLLTVLGIGVTVTVQDESGKIDLNAGSVNLISSLIQSAGQPAAKADEIAANIDAWRSDARLVPLADPKRKLSSQRQSFRYIDELQIVPGIDADLYKLLLPSVTVYSRHESVEESVAPYSVLLAVAPIDAQDIVQSRIDGAVSSNGPRIIQAGKVEVGIDERGWPFRIKCIFLYGKAKYALNAVLRLTGQAGVGFVLMSYSFAQRD